MRYALARWTAGALAAVMASSFVSFASPRRARADELDEHAERAAEREVEAEDRADRNRARRRSERVARQDRRCRNTVATWDFPAPSGCQRVGRPRYALVAGGSGLFVTGYSLHIIAFSQDDHTQGIGHLFPIVGPLLYTDENIELRIAATVGELIGLTMIILGFVITRPVFVVDETQVAVAPWFGPNGRSAGLAASVLDL